MRKVLNYSTRKLDDAIISETIKCRMRLKQRISISFDELLKYQSNERIRKKIVERIKQNVSNLELLDQIEKYILKQYIVISNKKEVKQTKKRRFKKRKR